MLDLVDYLVGDFVGRPYVALVRILMEGEKTLAELVESELAPYDVLTDSLKYLIKLDIVGLNKSGDRLTYCVVAETVLYFQRSTRYHHYIAHAFGKDEAMVVEYLLRNRPSMLEQAVRAIAPRKSGTSEC